MTLSSLATPSNPPPELSLSLHRQQSLILTPKANEILYGGAAGGGKSHAMRVMAIYFCCQIPGLYCVLFRKTFPELIHNHLEGPGSFHVLLAALVNSGHVRIVKGEIRFWNGSKIVLAHLQHEKTRFTWQGTEIHLLMFDELTHFSEASYRYLRGRCRLGGLKIPERFAGMFPRILSGSNPGGIGHTWVKRAFVNNGPYRIIQCEKEEGGMARVYIPATLYDNPSMTENDPEYANKLHGLGDAVLVRAMLEGDWSIVAGSMWGDVWRWHLHTVQPFAIPEDWPIWRGADDGYANYACVLWFTQDPETKTIYVIDELYRKGMLPETMANSILRHDKAIPRLTWDGQEERRDETFSGIIDCGAFADSGQTNGNEKSIPRGNVMNALGCKWKSSEKGKGSRVAGVQHIHRMLAPNPKCPEKKPALRFFSTCRNCIEILPTLPRDDKDPEDIDTDDPNDHIADALRYGLSWKFGGFKLAKVQGT